MTLPIGFFPQQTGICSAGAAELALAAPKKSLVRIAFPNRGTELTYFNDQFDLHPGDLVYVDGKLAGITGRVVAVHYNFKIRPSDYQKVIAVVDRSFHGELLIAGSHFLTFERDVLPVSKIARWFLPPEKEDEYIIGTDGESFWLDDLSAMDIGAPIAKRGYDYYRENRVVYLCVEEGKGCAIVTGTKNYEVNFVYDNGKISALTCTCPCGYYCKHEFGAMLQLRETLELAEDLYSSRSDGRYFAAISKEAFFTFAVTAMTAGKVCFPDIRRDAGAADPADPEAEDRDDQDA